VQCRLPGNPTPLKVESYKLDGVLDPDRAYRIGMRRLLGYTLQRLQHHLNGNGCTLLRVYGQDTSC
jgi:hypothetical protein